MGVSGSGVMEREIRSGGPRTARAGSHWVGTWSVAVEIERPMLGKCELFWGKDSVDIITSEFEVALG